jgi:hypothetical protein
MISVIISALISTTLSQWTSLPCTMHDYEGPLASDPRLYDNAAPYCGHRYSILNIARIVALPNMNPGLCNQCVEIRGEQSVYVLVVDQREAYGLDIASSSYQSLFPNDNVLNPHTCQYRIVDPSLCGKICYGSEQECTTGVRNLLPGYLLSETGIAPSGLGAGSARSGQSSENNYNQGQVQNQGQGQNQGGEKNQGREEKVQEQYHPSGQEHQKKETEHKKEEHKSTTTSNPNPSPTGQIVVGSIVDTFGSATAQQVSAEHQTFVLFNFVFLLAILF